jgi:hypothetical protein
MILYTEAQLDDAWRYDCKIRASKGKPWIAREQYRELFEALLDLQIDTLSPEVQDLVRDIQIHIPQQMIDSIQAIIDTELET